MKRRCLLGPSGLRWACRKKENSSRRQNDDSGRIGCSQGALPDGSVAPGGKAEGAGADCVYARGLEEAIGGTAAGERDRAGGVHQRLFRDERARGSEMAGALALGAHGRDRQFAQAQVGPAGHAQSDPEASGSAPGAAAGGMVSAGADSGAAVAGATALLGGRATGTNQEPGQESAGDARSAGEAESV